MPRHPDSYHPTDEELLALIRQHPLITLLELCLQLWCLPWRAPDPQDSLTGTPRRWPGVSRPLPAARWLHRRLLSLAAERRVLLDPLTCCREPMKCDGCLAGMSVQVLEPLSIDPARQEESITAVVAIEGRSPVVLQLNGTVGRVLRQTAQGLRPLGGAHLRGDDCGLELVAPGLSELETAALEDYLQSEERPRLPPEVELLVAALPGLEEDSAVHDRPRCPDCLTINGIHGRRCPQRPRPANDQGLPPWLGPIDQAKLDAALDRLENGHA